MRLIGILVSLALLGYVINIYLDSSPKSESSTYSSQQQEKLKQAKEAVNQLNEIMKKQQQKLDEAN